jgi:hypothetical protein
MPQVTHHFNTICQHTRSTYRKLQKCVMVVPDKCDMVDLWQFAVKMSPQILANQTLVILRSAMKEIQIGIQVIAKSD